MKTPDLLHVFLRLLLSLTVAFESTYASVPNTKIPPNAESALLTRLLSNYDARVRPMHNSSAATQLELTFLIEYIENMDEKDQVLKTWMVMFTSWKDEFLIWNPEDFDGIRHLTVSPDTLWVPDVYFFNGIDTFLHKAPPNYMLLWINHTGYVTKIDAGSLVSRCWVDISYFPFDTQTCDIIAEMFSSLAEQVYVSDVHLSIGAGGTQGSWCLDSYTYRPANRTYEADGSVYSRAEVSLKLSRKPLVNACFLVVPLMALSFIGLLPFCLPVESGEKVALSITALLSFTVYQTMLYDIMPESGSTMPYIAIYNMSVLVVSAFSLAGTVTVIRVHHKRGHVPDWLEAWILRLPCQPPGLPLRKHIIESLVLSNHSLNRSSTVSTICDGDGRTSPTPIIPRIRLKWPDVAKTLDRVLLVMLVGINAILIGYFLGIWMAYFVLHEST